MQQSIYINHLEIPHKAREFQAREQCKKTTPTTQHASKFLALQTTSQAQGHRNHHDTAENIALLSFFIVASTIVTALTAAPLPKPVSTTKKHNRHRFTTIAPQKTALEDIQDGTYSFHDFLDI